MTVRRARNLFEKTDKHFSRRDSKNNPKRIVFI
jgi:hypothetical protein